MIGSVLGHPNPEVLHKLHVGEAERAQQRRKGGPSVIVGGFQNVVLQRSLLKFTFGFLADLTFEIGVRRREETRVSGIDTRFGIVDAREQNLRFRKAQGN